MSFEAWTIFALFWVIFVTTPGPNALNRISNGLLYRQTDRGGVSDLAGHSRLVERGKPLWGMGLNTWVRRVMAACSSTMGFAGNQHGTHDPRMRRCTKVPDSAARAFSDGTIDEVIIAVSAGSRKEPTGSKPALYAFVEDRGDDHDIQDGLPRRAH